jgi:hypothetical protein
MAGAAALWLPALAAQAAYQEAGGQVVVEAEHYYALTPRSGKAWSVATATAGYAGSGYMLATPNTGVSTDTGYATTAPEVVYQIQFATPGTYYVWLRGQKPTGADDSVHVGIDATAVTTGDRLSSFVAGWSWSKATLDGPDATVVVAAAGLHTFHLWMREDGTPIDRFLLTTNAAAAAPSGTGPAESPTADATPPVISGTTATSITGSGATITWTTDESATTQVNYGATNGYGSSSPLVSTLTTSHTVTLSGLTASTLYHYRARSKDAAGNERVGSDLTFTTTSAPADTTPPTGSVSINGGAAVTNNRAVTLTLSATDTGGVTQMCFSNTSASCIGSAVAYAASSAWTLASGDGAKTVYVQFKDTAGNWSAAGAISDSVNLDMTPPSITIVDPTEGQVIIAPNM